MLEDYGALKIKQILLFSWIFFLGSIASASSTKIDVEDSAKIFLDFNHETSSSIENRTRAPELKSLEDFPDDYSHLKNDESDLVISVFGHFSLPYINLDSKFYQGIHSGLSPPLS